MLPYDSLLAFSTWTSALSSVSRLQLPNLIYPKFFFSHLYYIKSTLQQELLFREERYSR